MFPREGDAAESKAHEGNAEATAKQADTNPVELHELLELSVSFDSVILWSGRLRGISFASSILSADIY